MNNPDQSEQPLSPLPLGQSLLFYLLECRSLLLFDTKQILRFPNDWQLAQRSVKLIFWALPFFLILNYFINSIVIGTMPPEYLAGNIAPFGVNSVILFSLFFLIHQPLVYLIIYYISKIMMLDQNYPRWLLVHQSMMIWACVLLVVLLGVSILVPAFMTLTIFAMMVFPIGYLFFGYRYILTLDKATCFILIIMELVLHFMLQRLMSF